MLSVSECYSKQQVWTATPVVQTSVSLALFIAGSIAMYTTGRTNYNFAQQRGDCICNSTAIYCVCSNWSLCEAIR